MPQPVSNGILYGVQFAKELDDDVVARVARRAIERPDAYLTTEEMYSGIVEALASSETLTDFIPGPHSEQDYRDFLGRVVRQMDAMRPWPERPYLPVDPSSLDPGNTRLIGRIKLSIIGVEKRMHEPFARASDGRQAMALRLKSGAEVALAVGWWPDSKDIALMLADSHRAAADVLEEFSSATGITRDEIAPVERPISG